MRGQYRKAIQYYTRSIDHSQSARDKARAMLMMASAFLQMLNRQPDREAKIRSV
jgi:hypothetical protein